MRKILYISCFIIFFIFLGITDVSANQCSYSKLRELKNIAQQIKIGYEPALSQDNKSASFIVSVYNMSNKFYLRVQDLFMITYSKNTINIGSFIPGSTVEVAVYASNKTECVDERLYSTEIVLPYFNKYFSYDECVGNEKENICKKWYDTSSINEEEFIKIIDSKKNAVINKNYFEIIRDFFIKYWYFIIPLFALLVAITICIIIYKKKRVKIEI